MSPGDKFEFYIPYELACNSKKKKTQKVTKKTNITNIINQNRWNKRISTTYPRICSIGF